MSQSTRTVGKRGQVTIPKQVREELGITGGDRVRVERRGGSVIIRKRPSEEELTEAYRANAERDRQVYQEWDGVSKEANEMLGEPPEWDTDEAERS
ncbi:MAG: AbrB/MazE/SpoVT family DNA-binding domain-containing protein [Euryarchaeota archaeon]|jgi:AbrB family looped-hinge helix DNA binding protein|nr:AbrB/MazE/SpoVT family DNA-binding domain-containing protein [Euryarchaeota archaeon]